MKGTLQLIFMTEEGKRATLSVDQPKADLGEEEVKEAMDAIIASDAFLYNSSPLVAAQSAQIVERTVDKIF